MINEKKQENKRKSLYFDLSFIGSIIFLLFRIPLTTIIGNEGNGYFSITWELFTLFGLVFGFGLSNVISEMIRTRFRKNQYQNATNILTATLLTGVALSLAGAAIVYFVSNHIMNIFSMKLSGISFRLSAVLLIFYTISGVFRGYFEGTGTNIPTCFSKIVEALVAGTGALIFTVMLKDYGTIVGNLLFNNQYKPAFGAVGIIAGCICGSIFSLLFLLVVNYIYQIPLNRLLKKEEDRRFETLKNILKEIIKFSLITFIELLFFNLFRIINMGLYIRATLATDGEGKIIQYLGSYHGKVLVFVGIAILLVLSFSGRNKIRIFKSYHKSNYILCWRLFCEDLKQIVLFSIPFAIVIAVTGKNIFTAVFKSTGNIEITMLQIGSINIILIPIVVYIYQLLKRMDLNLILIMIPALAFILQTIIMSVIVKMPNIGSLSMIISETVFWFLIAVMEILVAIVTLKKGFKSKV